MVHLPHRNHKNSILKWSEFHLKKLAKSYEKHKKLRYLKKCTFLYSTSLNKIVSEWSIYPIETIKIRFGSGLDFTSKID